MVDCPSYKFSITFFCTKAPIDLTVNPKPQAVKQYKSKRGEVKVRIVSAVSTTLQIQFATDSTPAEV